MLTIFYEAKKLLDTSTYKAIYECTTHADEPYYNQKKHNVQIIV